MRPTLTLAAALSVLALAACQPTTTSSDSSNPNVGITTHSTVVSGAGQATEPAAPAAPTVVLKTRGTGIKNTAQFTVGDNWTIAYTFDCSTFGQAGNFAVSDETGMPLVNELKLKGSGSSPQYTGGTHHLEINSECDWTLTVTNG